MRMNAVDDVSMSGLMLVGRGNLAPGSVLVVGYARSPFPGSPNPTCIGVSIVLRFVSVGGPPNPVSFCQLGTCASSPLT